MFRKLLVSGALLALGACSFAQVAPSEDSAKAQQLSLGLFKILKQHDWRQLYSVAQFSAQVAASIPSADAFVQGVDEAIKQDPEDKFGKIVGSLSNIKVGMVVVEGMHAYAATTCTIDVPDHGPVTFLGVATFIKVGNDWKWDLAFSDDGKKAVERRVTELIGQPANPGS